MSGRAQAAFSSGLFVLTVIVLGLAAAFPDLRKDDLFKVLAQAIVLTGLVNLAASFYFGASHTQPPYIAQAAPTAPPAAPGLAPAPAPPVPVPDSPEQPAGIAGLPGGPA